MSLVGTSFDHNDLNDHPILKKCYLILANNSKASNSSLTALNIHHIRMTSKKL